VCRYIDGLPITASPEAFGLHQNADITRDQNDTALMFQSLASTSGGNSGGGPGGGASEALVAGLVRECLLALPPAFDLEAVQRKYPVLYEESMNTVLVQEMTRFNKLTGVIRESLQSIHLALQVGTPCALHPSSPAALPHDAFPMRHSGPSAIIASKIADCIVCASCSLSLFPYNTVHRCGGARCMVQGLVVMSGELEAAYRSISMAKVPDLWARVSYPSLKPLPSYLEDLYARLAMLQVAFLASL
jgi:hypothetical protein